ncbi:TPA: A/G-specific adenine glycosylase [Elizabethkingia meningoseptica]
MKNNIEKAYFLKLTRKILSWYDLHRRNLPWRETQEPYKIWISEIILQQTRVEQGWNHYVNFIRRFPTVKDLHEAEDDEVLLYWKGLGYYSRALNLHKASHQVIEEYNGNFPNTFAGLQQLKGVGKYTAAAIASICFGEAVPAIDGNFYRVFSRMLADDFDIASPKAYSYFYELIFPFVDKERPGDFNQAVMDLGSQVCKPKNPDCNNCPVNNECLAFGTDRVGELPVKKKKLKVETLDLHYYFVKHGDQFLIRQRDESFIWKKLYEFPAAIPEELYKDIVYEKMVQHKLTHKTLNITFSRVEVGNRDSFEEFISKAEYIAVDMDKSHEKSFPKPLEKIILEWG